MTPTVKEHLPDPQKLIERYRRAKERRSPWAGHWRECYEHALPQREAAITDTAPGAKKGTRLYDGTATDAVDQLAASLLSELTPPWDQWFDFKPGKEAPDEALQKIGEILGHAASVLQGHFDRSNFAVEMMLQPTNVLDSRLDPDRIRSYSDELDYREANGEPLLHLGGRRLVSASCFWDPSFGRPGRGDASVIAAVYTDQDGGYWLHGIEYMTHVPEIADRIDEATQLCRQAVSFARRHFVPAITIETNGVGRFLPGLFRRELGRAGLAAAVIEHASSRNKTDRILEAFDAVLAAGQLGAHRRVWDSPFIREMREWQPGGNGPDDGLDAVAGCLLAEPVRLAEPGRVRDPRARGMTAWRGSSTPVRINADFDV